MALAGALASATDELAIGHVVHDLRPREQAEADRDAARAVADRLHLPFAERRVEVAVLGGNAEANARRERYRALEAMAREAGCRLVATGHQADDALETILMALSRGAGLRGMGGIARCRREGAVRVIRPMLTVATRADCRRLCDVLGLAWREDETNADVRRFRAALRRSVVPELEQLRPGASRRAAWTGVQVRRAHRLIHESARELWDAGEATPRGRQWSRDVLRAKGEVLLGEVAAIAAGVLVNGAGLDRMGRESIGRLAGVIRDRSGESRVLTIGMLRWRVDGRTVSVEGRHGE